jgi:hypothetical protein
MDDEDALARIPAEAVVVGADAVTPSAVINKVKTRALAEAARRHAVPCYAVAGDTKFFAAELPVESPFERIPLELFTAIATPDGLLSTDAARAHAAELTLHPELASLVAELSGR